MVLTKGRGKRENVTQRRVRGALDRCLGISLGNEKDAKEAVGGRPVSVRCRSSQKKL